METEPTICHSHLSAVLRRQHARRQHRVPAAQSEPARERHRRGTAIGGRRALRRRETVLRRADRERALRLARSNAGACPTAAGDGAADSGAAAVRSARQPILDHQPRCAEHECEPDAAGCRAAPTTLDKSVKKYLPDSYRKSFNFVAPRTPNAVTDDAYHCAVRGAAPESGVRPVAGQRSAGARSSPAPSGSRSWRPHSA